MAGQLDQVTRHARCGALAFALALAGWSGIPAAAQDNALEYQVKATYLYKLGAFVDWPASAFDAPASAVNLCVAGKDPFDGVLDKAVEGQRVAGRPIVVRRFQTVVRDSGCQILFIGGSDQQSVEQALETVRGTSVLTVTDAADGDVAGIVHFVIADNHVRFTIDERAASLDGLAISSKLLSLATTVRPRS